MSGTGRRARERTKRALTASGAATLAHSHDPAEQYGVVVNPAKAQVFVPAAGDRVVVLAED